MSETIDQLRETCMPVERFYTVDWSLALAPFPAEQAGETLQTYITNSPSLRVWEDSSKIDTRWQDVLILKCADGICTCIVSPEWTLVSYNFVSSSITSIDFKNIKFPGKRDIWNFLAEHLMGSYKYGEKIRLVFSNGVYIVRLGVSSCDREMLWSSDIISATQGAVSEAIS